MSMQASQYGDKLRAVKAEVLEVNRLISRLQSETEAVKSQVLRRNTPLCLIFYKTGFWTLQG